MSWQPIATAPKDKSLLLFGTQKEPLDCGVTYLDPLVFSGYWDDIDGAWCSSGSTARGPFFYATHWMRLPEPPAIPAVMPAAFRGGEGNR